MPARPLQRNLRNGQSNQNVRGYPLVKLVLIYPVKQNQKGLYFILSLIWVNFHMLPRTLNKNTKKIKEKYIHETIIRTM